MRTSLIPLLLLSPLAFASGSSSNPHKANKRNHRRALEHSMEEREALVVEDVGHNSTLAKRQSFTGRGTFYYTDVGLGACGQHHGNDVWTVALNSAQYGGGYPGPQCFKSITISANGQTRGGIPIMDECPTCDWGGLDLSPGLFQQFAGFDAGVIQVTWWFDGSGPAPTQAPTTTQPPTSAWTPPSSTWSPSPSSTWTTSTTSSTWTTSMSSTTTPPPSSSSSSSSSSTSSYNATTNPFAVVASVNGTASSTASGSSASASATGNTGGMGSSGNTAPIVIQSNGNNLEGLNGLVTNYGQIIVVGAGGYVA